jgi:hypothetical protein
MTRDGKAGARSRSTVRRRAETEDVGCSAGDRALSASLQTAALMEAAPGPSREASVPSAVAPQSPSSWPTRDAAAPWSLPARALWLAGAAVLLVVAAFIVLSMQVTSAGHRAAVLEARAAALAAEVEALQATEAAAASRMAEVRAQVEELRRQVDVLSARAPVLAAPPTQAVPSTPPPPPPPPAPPRASPRR